VHRGEPVLVDLEAYATRWINQIDELPRDNGGSETGGDGLDGTGGEALDEAAHSSAETDFDFGDAEVEVVVGSLFPTEMDVVDANDLAAVDVDDLLVEQITFEKDDGGVIRMR
jgi:hypothetical protein